MYVFTCIAGTAHAEAGLHEKAIEFCQRSLRENKMYTATHKILTVSLALSGHIVEARQAAGELLKLEPYLTVRDFQKRYPGNSNSSVTVFCEALAAAGIPP